VSEASVGSPSGGPFRKPLQGCKFYRVNGLLGRTASAVPSSCAKMVMLVPFQPGPPNITMTRRHLDRPSQNLVICPNKLERHWGKRQL